MTKSRGLLSRTKTRNPKFLVQPGPRRMDYQQAGACRSSWSSLQNFRRGGLLIWRRGSSWCWSQDQWTNHRRSLEAEEGMVVSRMHFMPGHGSGTTTLATATDVNLKWKIVETAWRMRLHVECLRLFESIRKALRPDSSHCQHAQSDSC